MSLPSDKVEEAKQVFEVYDKKYEGKVDAFYIGDMLRALNLAPTQSRLRETRPNQKGRRKNRLNR